MEKVYVVTKGEYSDFRICEIFSTKELAEEYIAYYDKINPDEYEKFSIEEWDVDCKHKTVGMLKKGWVFEYNFDTKDVYEEELFLEELLEETRPDINDEQDMKRMCFVRIKRIGEYDKVKKIFYDYLGKIKAIKEGI